MGFAAALSFTCRSRRLEQGLWKVDMVQECKDEKDANCTGQLLKSEPSVILVDITLKFISLNQSKEIMDKYWTMNYGTKVFSHICVQSLTQDWHKSNLVLRVSTKNIHKNNQRKSNNQQRDDNASWSSPPNWLSTLQKLISTKINLEFFYCGRP